MNVFSRVLEQAERERAVNAAERERAASAEAGRQARAGSPPPAPPERPAATPRPATRLDEADATRPLTPVEPAAPPTPGPRLDEFDATRPLTQVEPHLVSLLHPTSFLAEPYRELRHIVEQRRRTAQLSIIAVSSAGDGEGKTTTSINLAGALAQAPGSRVLLVDADLRKSSVTRHLGLGDVANRGLVDAILDPNLSLDDVVRPRPPFNLDVLPAGALPSAPYEVLKSRRLEELLDEARRRYDYVVIDTAPLVPVPDSRLIGKLVDGFLLVVAAHKTRTKSLAAALNLMEPAKLVGLVFNGDDDGPSSHYGAASGGQRPSWRSLWRRTPRPSAARG
jgi:protein-tyrosine kinase